MVPNLRLDPQCQKRWKVKLRWVIAQRGRDREARTFRRLGGGRGFDLNTKKHLEPNQQQIVVPS